LGFGQPLLLTLRDDVPIKSTNETTPDGRPWFLRGNPYDPGTTSTYDPNFGTERGCRGTVIFTVQ
jgi:hypothetical protein